VRASTRRYEQENVRTPEGLLLSVDNAAMIICCTPPGGGLFSSATPGGHPADAHPALIWSDCVKSHPTLFFQNKKAITVEPVGKWESPVAFYGAFPLFHRLGFILHPLHGKRKREPGQTVTTMIILICAGWVPHDNTSVGSCLCLQSWVLARKAIPHSAGEDSPF